MHLGQWKKYFSTVNSSCDGGQDCPTYKFWCDYQGSTVVVTKGAFRGTIGRLNALGETTGEIVFRTGGGCCAEYQYCWVKYSDLALTDKCLGADNSRVPECQCCTHCCCHSKE